MSALNFFLDDRFALVSTDTLVTRPNDPSPYRFMSKMVYLPQLKSVICGIGNPDLFADWINYLQKNVVAYDINHLNDITTNILPELATFKQAYTEQPLSLYQFGQSLSDGLFHGFVYRSKDGFVPEALAKGLVLNPALDKTQEDMSVDFSTAQAIEDSMIALMEKQKSVAAEAATPIGGEIQMIQLTDRICVIKTLKAFADYPEQQKIIEEEILSQSEATPPASN